MSARLSFDQAVLATGGRLLAQPPDPAAFEGVSIDSRKVRPGQAFVAIAGDRHDGHHFLDQAVARGAALLVASLLPTTLPPRTPVLLVEDTRAALGALASAWRQQLAPEVVAITGSIGKTTTKELVSQILRAHGTTHANQGNFNNDIGLPLTLLAMPAGTRYLVTEMGMNAPGEIAHLARIARPNVGVVTNVAPVHLEGLGSIEAIAQAKGELLDQLQGKSWAIIPDDERRLAKHVAHLLPTRQLRFGWSAQADARLLQLSPHGAEGSDVELALQDATLRFRLPLVGRHNALNAAAAAAVGLALSVPSDTIAAALARAPTLTHRSVLARVGRWQLLDDCYNASPRAMEAALDTLLELADGAPAIAVLGTMGELGADAERYHLEVGRHAGGLPLAALVCVGDQARAIAAGAREVGFGAAVEVPDAAQAVQALAALPDGWLLVKASREAKLEQLIERLRSDHEKSSRAATDPTSS